MVQRDFFKPLAAGVGDKGWTPAGSGTEDKCGRISVYSCSHINMVWPPPSCGDNHQRSYIADHVTEGFSPLGKSINTRAGKDTRRLERLRL